MKRILIAIVAIAMTTSVMASDFGFGKTSSPKSFSPSFSTGMYTVDDGNMVISFGYGAPNISKSIYSIYSGYDDFKIKGMGPLHAKFEYFLSDRFGVGVVANYVSTSANWKFNDGTNTYNESYDYSSLAFNIRFNWHFYNEDGFDFYAGSGIGYKISNYKLVSDDPLGTHTAASGGIFPLGFEVTAGGRYFITDMFGIYAEVGLAKSIIQGGLCIKL